MKLYELYTKDDKSYIQTEEIKGLTLKHLGLYSAPYAVESMMFRESNPGDSYDWHTAPRPQYIIYLEGEVEVIASGGDKRIFKPGDILFANDTSGKGHISRVLKPSKAIIVTARS